MTTLIINIKELLQVRNRVAKVSGAAMATLPTIKTPIYC
jgi:hypothetical protein